MISDAGLLPTCTVCSLQCRVNTVDEYKLDYVKHKRSAFCLFCCVVRLYLVTNLVLFYLLGLSLPLFPGIVHFGTQGGVLDQFQRSEVAMQDR